MKRRREEGAATKLQMASQMQILKDASSSLRDWRATCCARFGMQWMQLQAIYLHKSTWQNRVETFKIGLQSRSAAFMKGQGSKGGASKKKGGLGSRAPGEGRKDKFRHVKLRVKRWLELERSRLHHVDKVDLLEEFLQQCRDEQDAVKAELLEREAGGMVKPVAAVEDEASNVEKQSCSSVSNIGACTTTTSAAYEGVLEVSHVKNLSTEDLKAWENDLSQRLERLQPGNIKYRSSFADKLAEDVHAVLLKPSRLSTLSLEEECARVCSSWMNADLQMWRAAFGSEEMLQSWVADPKHFMECRQKVVLGCSDQIPVWVKVGRSKQLYLKTEVAGRHRKRKKTSEGPTAESSAGTSAALPLEDQLPEEADGQNQQLVEPLLKAAVGMEGSSLPRQTGDATAEKFRVTYEHRALVLNYFNEGEDPVGVQWHGALVVKGAVHCRLHNISEAGLQLTNMLVVSFCFGPFCCFFFLFLGMPHIPGCQKCLPLF